MKLAGVGDREEFYFDGALYPLKRKYDSMDAARCDPPNYGRLLVYNFPKHKLVYGTQHRFAH